MNTELFDKFTVVLCTRRISCLIQQFWLCHDRLPAILVIPFRLPYFYLNRYSSDNLDFYTPQKPIRQNAFRVSNFSWAAIATVAMRR